MTDPFETLGLPRLPFFTEEELQNRFLERAATAHPDQGGDAEEFASINAAHQLLKDPTKRLRRLAELEGAIEPGKAPSTIPDQAMAHFGTVQAALATADALVKRAEQSGSSLGRALLAREAILAMEQCDAISAILRKALQEMEESLQSLNLIWETDRAAALSTLLPLIGGFSFLRKWCAQLQERSFQLSHVILG